MTQRIVTFEEKIESHVSDSMHHLKGKSSEELQKQADVMNVLENCISQLAEQIGTDIEEQRNIQNNMKTHVEERLHAILTKMDQQAGRHKNDEEQEAKQEPRDASRSQRWPTPATKEWKPKDIEYKDLSVNRKNQITKILVERISAMNKVSQEEVFASLAQGSLISNAEAESGQESRTWPDEEGVGRMVRHDGDANMADRIQREEPRHWRPEGERHDHVEEIRTTHNPDGLPIRLVTEQRLNVDQIARRARRETQDTIHEMDEAYVQFH